MSCSAVVDSIIEGTNYQGTAKGVMHIGVDAMPTIPKDTADRNRTSPIAFTGNKFEFRMLGSSQSIAGPNIALNTIMAEELGKFADILESSQDKDAALQKLVQEAFRDHKRIIFNGNGYSQQWQEEAAARGLSNLSSTIQAMPTYVSAKNVDLVTRHGIYTETEFFARYQIHLDSYSKHIKIEAKTMVDMVMHQILPAAIAYSSDLAKSVMRKETIIGCASHTEKDLTKRISRYCSSLYENTETLAAQLKEVPSGSLEAACYFGQTVVAQMEKVRYDADKLEKLTSREYWPYPIYADILYY